MAYQLTEQERLELPEREQAYALRQLRHAGLAILGARARINKRLPWHATEDDVKQGAWLGVAMATRAYKAASGFLPSALVERSVFGQALKPCYYDEKIRVWLQNGRKGIAQPFRLPQVIPVDFSEREEDRGESASVSRDDYLAREAEGRVCEPDAQMSFLEDADLMREIRRRVFRLMRAIPNDRERHILRRRFWYGWTLQQCGDEYGLSRERARQLEARALEFLREAIRDDPDLAELMRSAPEEA